MFSFLYFLWKAHFRFYRSIFFGDLKKAGWSNTVRHKKVPYDGDMKPIMTYAYAAVLFVQERVNKNMSVFEFGSGHSTLRYATLVKDVTAVEHFEAWYNYLKAKAPSNVNMIFAPLEDGNYPKLCLGGQYDVIIVDGRQRVACMKNCLGGLKPNGVVILDDSQREEYTEGMDFLMSQGFRRLDFKDFAMGDFLIVRTTIFYKDGNCFGI